MRRLAFFVGYGLLVHLLAAPVSDLLFGTHVGDHYLRGDLAQRAQGFVLFGGLALLPLAGFGAVGALVRRAEATTRAVRWMSRAGGVCAVVTAFAAQVLTWSQLHTDAQAAVLFLFMPFYAALASTAVGLAALLLGAAWPTRAPPAAP